MLKLNPNEIIKYTKLMNQSFESIQENINLANKKYLLLAPKKPIDFKELKKSVQKLKNDTNYLEKMIHEIEEATGLSRDKLLSYNYSNAYYEDKILSYYAKKIYNNNLKKVKTNLDLLYSYYDDNNDQLSNYCQKEVFLRNYQTYLKNFDYKKYGIDKETLEKELIYVYDKRGYQEAYNLLIALRDNCPSNYSEYQFNPHNTTNKNAYYDFNNSTIDNYLTNSENITINGYTYEFVQVLPKDCTNIEYLAYNFCKANVINTMKALPDAYLKYNAMGNSNAIVLTCDRKAMNNGGTWSGYYKSSAIFERYNNMLVIDAHGSFQNNEYYTQDTIIHEMGHKFDDMLHSDSFFDNISGKVQYTTNNSNWSKAYQKYGRVLNGINPYGYETFPNVKEFFGDATVAYFKSPNDLKRLCPEVYDLINEMLGEQNYNYNNQLQTVLKVSNGG